MALTAEQKRARNAGYQARWRAKRDALARANSEVAERALLQAAERCERLSVPERTARTSLPMRRWGICGARRSLRAWRRRVRLGEDVGER